MHMQQHIQLLVETTLIALILTILVIIMENIFDVILQKAQALRDNKNNIIAQKDADIQNRDVEIQNLRNRVSELESQAVQGSPDNVLSFFGSEGV